MESQVTQMTACWRGIMLTGTSRPAAPPMPEPHQRPRPPSVQAWEGGIPPQVLSGEAARRAGFRYRVAWRAQPTTRRTHRSEPSCIPQKMERAQTSGCMYVRASLALHCAFDPKRQHQKQTNQRDKEENLHYATLLWLSCIYRSTRSMRMSLRLTR